MNHAARTIAQLENDTRRRIAEAHAAARGLEGALDTWSTLMSMGEWKTAARFWWDVVAPMMSSK